MTIRIGTWVSCLDVTVAEVMAQAAFDFFLIDGEHGHAPVHRLHTVAGIFEAANRSICYRVSANRSELIKSALDQGARSVMIPLVNTVEEALAAVAAAKYAPLGARGIGPLRASRYYTEFEDYLARANTSTELIVQIETKGAVQNAARIAEIEGVDQLYIGPADLASSLGVKLGSLGPEMEKALTTVADAARAAGKIAGIDCHEPSLIERFASMGFSFFSVGGDLQYLAQGARVMADCVEAVRGQRS